MHIIASERKPSWSRLSHALIILPAGALGVLAMVACDISPMLYGQQIAALAVCALLCMLRRPTRKAYSVFGALLLIATLAATLFYPTIGGAKRWLDLGPLNVNASMLVVPALLVLLSGMAHPCPALLFGSAVLCLQPDISQLTAFSLGALPILWQHQKRTRWFSISLVVLAALILRCSFVPTALEPVSYCEGILAMLGQLSPLLQAIGWLTLAFIPGWFAYRFLKHRVPALLCLAIYYTVALIFTLTGEYPVPFMGFGLSPIVGYGFASLFIPSPEDDSTQ